MPQAQTRAGQNLMDDRNRTVARSFFQHLRREGFSHQEIIRLSTNLLDLVTDDLSNQGQATAK